MLLFRSFCKLANLAARFPRLKPTHQTTVFLYLSQNNYRDPASMRAAQLSLIKNSGLYKKQQLMQLLRGYLNYKQYFGEPLMIQRALDRCVRRLLNELKEDKDIFLILKFYQSISRNSYQMLNELLTAVYSQRSHFGWALHVQVVISNIQNSVFNQKAILSYLTFLVQNFQLFKQERAVFTLAYVLFSDLIETKLGQVKERKLAVSAFTGQHQIDQLNFSQFLEKLQLLKDQRIREAAQLFMLKQQKHASLYAFSTQFLKPSQKLCSFLMKKIETSATLFSPIEICKLSSFVKDRRPVQRYIEKEQAILSKEQLQFLKAFLKSQS